MVILSSEEFRNQENNRIQMGLEGLINKINLQSTRGFGHDGINPTVETSLNNNEYIGYLMINNRVAASGFGNIDGQGGEGNKYKENLVLIDAVLDLNEKKMEKYIAMISDGHITREVIKVLDPTKATSFARIYTSSQLMPIKLMSIIQVL